MNFRPILAAGATLLSLTACVDDKYDLSDVDTTVKIPVNDLTVPVNIEPIDLDNIFGIDYSNPDNVVKVIDGEYVVTRNGDFESDNIEVDDITLARPDLNGSQTDIDLGMDIPAGMFPPELTCPIKSDERSFNFESSDVSEYIDGIDGVTCDMSLIIHLSFPQLSGTVRTVTFTDVKLQLPKGLVGVSIDNLAGATYSKTTGVLDVPPVTAPDAKATITLRASGVDFKYLLSVGEATFTSAKQSHTAAGNISVNGKFYLLSGNAVIKSSDVTLPAGGYIPRHLALNIDYDMSPTVITSFTGNINYSITNVDIPEVKITNLPDILNQSGTDVSLVNPQIYLRVTNPLTEYHLSAQAGISVTAKREGHPDRTYTLGQKLVLDTKEAPDGVFYFVLSPINPTTRPQGYENAKWLEFADLGDVLSGDGIPTALKFDLIDPEIPVQHVTDFKLDRNLGTVHGDYDIYAPLGLKAGSQIVYADNVDGWNDDELNRCTIEKLSVSFDVSTDIPVAVTLTGYPIDINGKQIVDANGKPVTIDGAVVPANAGGVPLTVRTTGVIPPDSDIDGIHFVATARADKDNEALRPDMKFTLSNIRASVTGYYIKEL